jgi:hypothetical protein
MSGLFSIKGNNCESNDKCVICRRVESAFGANPVTETVISSNANKKHPGSSHPQFVSTVYAYYQNQNRSRIYIIFIDFDFIEELTRFTPSTQRHRACRQRQRALCWLGMRLMVMP